MNQWRLIEYREFHDVPRMIVAADGRGTFLFYSRFDEQLDDYRPHYEVYRLPELSTAQLSGSWEDLEKLAIDRDVDIPVNELPFQVKRR